MSSHGGATLELTNLHMHNICQTTHVQRTVGGGELVRNVDLQEKSCKNDVVQTSPSKLKILTSLRVKTIALVRQEQLFERYVELTLGNDTLHSVSGPHSVTFFCVVLDAPQPTRTDIPRPSNLPYVQRARSPQTSRMQVAL